jgi:DNA-directed RNA polymerase specialized sigma24 family protein
MSDRATFQELLDRVRAGDQVATTELVRRYEPAVRRTVRIRLVDTRLLRALESTDVCQSVMKSFLTPAALERHQLESPEDLLKLLGRMTRNKVADRVRRERAVRRDYRRLVAGGVPPDRPAPGRTPSHVVASRELYERAKKYISADEMQIWELREAKFDWEIAGQLGGTGEAARKKLERAFKRVRRALAKEEDIPA